MRYLFVYAFLLLVHLTSSAQFASPENIDVNPYRDVTVMDVVDMDNDGSNDLICSYNGFRAGIFWNQGDETFDTFDAFDASYSYSRLFVTDYDQDGDLDIFFSTVQDLVYLRRNLGDRSFSLEYLMTGKIQALYDYDDDGKDDLMLHTDQHNLMWHRNLGGEFSEVTYVIPGFGSLSAPQELQFIGDLNADGEDDFQSTGEEGLEISFDPGNLLEDPILVPETRFARFANLDDDPELEFIYWETSATSVANSLFLGNFIGDESYDIETIVQSHVGSACIMDGNHDGILDIVFGSSDDGSIVLLVNDGQGNFDSPSLLNSENLNAPTSLGSFRVDGDSAEDLLINSNHDDQLSIMLGGGGLEGKERRLILKPAIAAVDQMHLIDYNQDGFTDIVLSSPTASSMIGIPNDGGIFTDEKDEDLAPASTGTNLQGDLNNDGLDDLLISGPEYGVLRVINFAQSSVSTLSDLGISNVDQLFDVNADGYLDLVDSANDYMNVCYATGSAFEFEPHTSFFEEGVYIPGSPFVILENLSEESGDPVLLLWSNRPGFRCEIAEGFEAGKFSQIEQTYASGANRPTMIDYDGDGLQDILTINCAAQQLSVQQSDYNFWEDSNIDLPGQIACLSEDLNLDGKEDLLCMRCSFPRKLNFHTNESPSGFSEENNIETPIEVKSFLLEDMDNDGDQDIVALGFQDELMLFRNLHVALSSEEALSGNIVIYPNPASDLIQIESTIAGDQDYELFDQSGKLLKFGSASSGNWSLSCKDLASGTYVLKLSNDKMTARQTLLIQK